MANPVTAEEIQRMNELYLAYGTYSAVAREIGRSASTVKKYIDPNFDPAPVKQELISINWARFEDLAPISLTSELCELKKGELD